MLARYVSPAGACQDWAIATTDHRPPLSAHALSHIGASLGISRRQCRESNHRVRLGHEKRVPNVHNGFLASIVIVSSFRKPAGIRVSFSRPDSSPWSLTFRLQRLMFENRAEASASDSDFSS